MNRHPLHLSAARQIDMSWWPTLTHYISWGVVVLMIIALAIRRTARKKSMTTATMIMWAVILSVPVNLVVIPIADNIGLISLLQSIGGQIWAYAKGKH